MAYAQQQQHDIVSGEQYRYALTNFVSRLWMDVGASLTLSQRIAHEKVEQQRQQLEEQERQVALLRERIGLLEGNDQSQRSSAKQGGSSVDDFSIKVNYFPSLLLSDGFTTVLPCFIECSLKT